jgi:hypothetical protein
MKTLGVFIGLLVLCSFGLSAGGQLWASGHIPAWLISLFLLPAALFLDFWMKGDKTLSVIRKYSTTIGVLCMTLAGYLSMEFLAVRIIFATALALPFIFFPELLFHFLSKSSGSTEKHRL